MINLDAAIEDRLDGNNLIAAPGCVSDQSCVDPVAYSTALVDNIKTLLMSDSVRILSTGR